MKLNFFLIIILLSVKVNCQLRNLGEFYSKKLNKSNENHNISFYKIKGKIYETDHQKYFALGKQKISFNDTDDLIHYMIYKKKYLFIGYYPRFKEQLLPSGGNEFRLLRKFEVIDLENPKKKWIYQFDKKTSMINIKSFNPKDGNIIHCNHRKPEKVVTD